MSEHHAGVRWKKTTADFTYDSYNRSHEIWFKGGAIKLAATAAPEFRGNESAANPEETLVAALSSCHMLTFLAICARKRMTVESYEDDAVGYLEKGPTDDPKVRRLWLTRVVLRPLVRFAGPSPDEKTLSEIHKLADQECFIANSVKTEIFVEPRD